MINNPDRRENVDTGYKYEWDADGYRKGKNGAWKKSGGRGAFLFAAVMITAFAVCFGILAGLLAYNVKYGVNLGEAPVKERTIYIKDSDGSEDGVLTIPEIKTKVGDSVVGITASGSLGTSVGTGIIMTEDGYIATNSHVIEDCDTFKVIMSDKTEMPAILVGNDNVSDLAVLKIAGNGYKAVTFGDSDSLIVGEKVVAIGNPGGLELMGTVTDGIITGVDRQIKIYNEYTGAHVKTMNVIQTNASLNSGNSGGPLINMYGEVIGINTLKLKNGYEGVGFAIPINGALGILDSIIETGSAEGVESSVAKKRAMIGITGRTVSDADAQNDGSVAGVLVVTVDEKSDAYANGLRAGDIIVSFCGGESKTIDAVINKCLEMNVGDNAYCTVWRAGEYIDIAFVLVESAS